MADAVSSIWQGLVVGPILYCTVLPREVLISMTLLSLSCSVCVGGSLTPGHLVHVGDITIIGVIPNYSSCLPPVEVGRAGY